MSFSIDNLNSSAISFVLFYERPLQTELSPPTLFPEDEAVGRSALGHVEKAQARNSKLFQQPLLHILLFNHCQLLRFHLPPVTRELTVHLAPYLEYKFFRRMAGQQCMYLLVQNRQPPLQILQIQRPRRVEDICGGLQRIRNFRQTAGDLRLLLQSSFCRMYKG